MIIAYDTDGSPMVKVAVININKNIEKRTTLNACFSVFDKKIIGYVEPLKWYFNPIYPSLLVLTIMYIFWGFSAWMIIGIVIGLPSILLTRFFVRKMLALSLKKNGYKGELKIMADWEAIEEVMRHVQK